MVLEMLVYLLFSHLMQLLQRKFCWIQLSWKIQILYW